MSNKVTKQIRVKTDATLTGDGTYLHPLHVDGVGVGDMLKATYDPAGGNKQVAFSADLGTAAAQNVGYFATAAQGVLAGTSWQLNGNTLGAKKTFGSIDNQDIGLITNNTERLTVVSNGNVGIGTTSPAYTLDVTSATGNPTLRVSGGTGVTPQINLVSTGVSAESASMYFLGGSGGGQSYFGYRNGFNIGTATGVGSAITTKWSIDGSGNTTQTGNLVVQGTGNTTIAGNVGIGTTGPTSLLHLYATSNPKLTLQESGGNFVNLFAGQALSVFQFNSSKNFGITAAATISDGGENQYSQVTFGATRDTAFGDMAFNPTDNGYRVDIQTAGSNGALRVGTGTTAILGNVGIGTTAPTGKIDIQGLAIHDLPTYSAEFLLSTNWTSIDWTGDFVTGWTHTTGNVTVLAQSKLAVSATKYQIAYTVTGITAGSFTIGFGGQSIGGLTATGVWGPTTTSTASLTITPTNDFNGTIVISIKSITAVSTPLVNLKSSDGTARIEMRANTASGNTFIGVGAGRYNTTGYYNTANGVSSLQSNTTGNSNTANGVNSLYSNTTGYQNTANGYVSLYSNTTGYQNTTNGVNSLYYNTTGYQNTANGYVSLYSNTTGYSNTANGYASLYYNTTGNDNTTNGVSSLYYNTTGYNNTANGYASLYSNTTGNNNTANGYASLYSNTTGYQNTANGFNAGRTLITGNSNTFFGYTAGYNASQKTDAVNSMALGNGAFTTLDNQVVIGNTSVTQTLLNGNVGIGITAPTALLNLKAGTATAGTAPLKFTSGTLLATPEVGTMEFTDDGTTAHIYGTIRIAGVITRVQIV